MEPIKKDEFDQLLEDVKETSKQASNLVQILLIEKAKIKNRIACCEDLKTDLEFERILEYKLFDMLSFSHLEKK